MEAIFTGAGRGITIDQRDHDILNDRIIERDKFENPRVGDFVEFADGIVHRFSHDWGDTIQTSPNGSFYFHHHGVLSFSGGLNPGIPAVGLIDTGEDRLGSAWFFHHEFAGADRGVYAEIPCRVYKTRLNSDHWHNKPKSEESR